MEDDPMLDTTAGIRALLMAVTLIGCSDGIFDPLAAPPPRPPVQPPVTPVTPALPTAPEQATIFDRLFPATVGSESRYLLLPENRFRLEYIGTFGYLAFPGRYSAGGDSLVLEFDGASGWTARARVAGDTLSVSYNLVMQMSGFEDGTFLRWRPMDERSGLLSIVPAAGGNSSWTLGVTPPSALAAQVVDSTGNPIPTARVLWEVVSGAGEFQIHVDSPRVAQLLTRTSNQGFVWPLFEPSVYGHTQVSATIVSQPDRKVVFDLDAVPVGRIRVTLVPVFDCFDPVMDPTRFTLPPGVRTAIVPVGQTIVWEFFKEMHPSCLARVLSTTVPEGAAPYASDDLAPGDSASFTPTVAGIWMFTDKYSGGKLSVTVLAPAPALSAALRRDK
jgi:hypothetical protein